MRPLAATRARRLRDEAERLLHASPGYAFAAFLHLLIIVVLSLLTVAGAVRKQASRPIAVRMVAQSTVALVEEPERALDDAPRLDADAEVATDDPFQEALGQTAGHQTGHADAAYGLAGGGGAGRGGERDAAGGATAASDGAIRAALEWLKRHRTPDGAWGKLHRAHGANKRLAREADSAYTALALLCYLCAGEAERVDGPYSALIECATQWLMRCVGPDGEVRAVVEQGWGGVDSAYHATIVTLALSEALARRPSIQLQDAVTRLVRRLERCQDPVDGGWRYRPREPADTSVTGWAVLALKSAEHAGVAVSPDTWAPVQRFLDSVSKDDGKTEYMPGEEARASYQWESLGMHATGLFLRVMLGESPETPRNRAAADRVEALPDTPDGLRDAYASYYGALAMYQVGGVGWREFNPRLRDGVVARQEGGDGCEAGSWCDDRRWMRDDVVLSTVFACLTLETYYRYLPVHGEGGRRRSLTADGQLGPGEAALSRAWGLLDEARRRAEAADASALLAAEGALEESLAQLQDDAAKAEARAGLVQAAALSRDPGRVLARATSYLAGLPPGRMPDRAVLRARRVAFVERALEVARGALDPRAPAPVRQAAEAELEQLERGLREDVASLVPGSPSHEEGQALMAHLEAVRHKVAVVLNPDVARFAAVDLPPPTGEVPAQELELVFAALLRAQRAYVGPARADAAALELADADVAWVEGRALEDRRLDASSRARVRAARRKTELTRLAALQALGRDRDALLSIGRLTARPDPPRAAELEPFERASLQRLLARGQARADDKARLVTLSLARAARDADAWRAEDWLLLGDLMQACDAPAAMLDCAARALACTPAPQGDQVVRARLLRIRAHGALGDAAATEADVVALEEAGLEDRVDVRLARCALLRGLGRHDDALLGYHEVLRALEAERPGPWWTACEEAALTYVAKGDLRAARRLLAELQRRDPTYGGDEARKRRFIDLTVKVDNLR